jgi:hypothetical protein
MGAALLPAVATAFFLPKSRGLTAAHPLFVVVCSGNAGRPHGGSFAMRENRTDLVLSAPDSTSAPVFEVSDGIPATRGRPPSAHTREVLRRIGILPHPHASRDSSK